MRKKLKELRMKKGFETQEKFAIELGVSLKTYNNIERGYSFPREPLLKQIMQVLKTTDLSIFENINEKSRGEVSEKICEYMNMLAREGRIYTLEVVNKIRAGLTLELEDRKENQIIIKSNTKQGKWEIYKRAATIVKEKYKITVSAEDVWLFKNCTRLEFEIRTGKTTWGIPKERKRLGCNPVSGYIGKKLRLKREKDNEVNKLNIKRSIELNRELMEVTK